VSEQYQVAVTARAARDLDRLPRKIATACVEFIFGPTDGGASAFMSPHDAA